MVKKFHEKTTVVVVSLVLTTMLICLVAYEQLEILSLKGQNNHLNKDLNENSSLINLTKAELSSLHEDYSTLLKSYNNLTIRLQLLEDSLAPLSEALEHLERPIIFFDKNIYYPSQEAFWNQSYSTVSITITVLDKSADSDSLTVEVSSSCGFKEVMLQRVLPGIFSATFCLVAPGTNQASPEDSSFHANYGDRIVAIYDDWTHANALFAFPKIPGDHGNYSYWETWTFDPQGLPLVNHGGSIGLVCDPLFVGTYALTNYGRYLDTGNSSFRERFFALADWYVETVCQKGNFSVWEYDFQWPWGLYNVTVPYVSALTQGVGMSVLLRAYFLSKNSTYLEVGRSAMMAFGTEMQEGGVRYTDLDGVWYEEIADEGAVSGKVLNCFLSVLINLYEYHFGLNDAIAYGLFLEGVSTLSKNIYRYDTGSWSYYDLLHRGLASLDYHKTHIDQLTIMYKLTNDETFLEYSIRFQSYLAARS